jgi:hypothetical protein
MVHYEDDYQKGKRAQHEIFPIVKEFFADYNLEGDIVENPDDYDKYDYECDDAVFEVKTRFDAQRTSYKTTMMTCNKVTKTKKAIIFIFNYTDEISWIQYDEDLFNTFEKKLFSRANIKSDEKDYWYIPVHCLQTLYKKPSKCLINLKRN